MMIDKLLVSGDLSERKCANQSSVNIWVYPILFPATEHLTAPSMRSVKRGYRIESIPAIPTNVDLFI